MASGHVPFPVQKNNDGHLDELSTNAGESSRESMRSGLSATALKCFPLNVIGSEWQATLAKARTAIVLLRVSLVRHFQEEEPGTSTSTGFVVHAEEGLILTNRHAVSHGPSRVTAIFLGSEELPCDPVYSDPIHDFAFVRCNLRKLCHTKVVEIPLCPGELEVGLEIRVVGNDDGEQHQVLPGIVARVDREVPECDEYSDENTFYVAAASNTAEGSSGSPVLNRAGHCVALNTASASGGGGGFFLPLERICRCLRLLLQREPVPRGTLGASFVFRGLEEARRLGLAAAAQKTVLARTPHGRNAGALTVLRTLRGSTGAKHLRSGDLLLELGGKLCLDFVSLEEYLDANVCGTAAVRICRDGNVLDLNIPVEDLAMLVPSDILEFGFGVFHDIGYQLAAVYNLPVRNAGVFVARAGIVFEEALGNHTCAVIHVNGHPTPNLEDFKVAIAGLVEHESFTFGFLDLSELSKRRTPQEGTACMAWTWTGIRAWQAKGQARRWQPMALPQLQPMVQEDRPSSPEPERSMEGRAESQEDLKAACWEKALAKLRGSLALVQFRGAGDFTTESLKKSGEASEDEKREGVHTLRKGAALVLDAAAGLCVTDRISVPELLGYVELVFCEAGDHVQASVIFLHPHHNFAFLRYDPSHLKTPAFSAQFSDQVGRDGQLQTGEDEGVSEEEGEEEDEDDDEEDDAGQEEKEGRSEGGDGQTDEEEDRPGGRASKKRKTFGLFENGYCCFVGLDENGELIGDDVQVAGMGLPSFQPMEPPCWRHRNAELVSLWDDVEGIGGVLCDDVGGVLALYFGFPPKEAGGEVQYHGLSAEHLGNLAKLLAQSSSPLACRIPSLDLELASKPLGALMREPRARRLPSKWIRRLTAAMEAQGREASQVLSVSAVMPRGAAEGLVQVGDLILEVNGVPMVSSTTLDRALQSCGDTLTLTLTIFRKGQIVDATLSAAYVPSDGARRVLLWAGAVLRETPRAVCEAFGLPEDLEPPGVFCTKVLPGSPAEEYGLEGNCFLRSAGGLRLRSLDDLLSSVKQKEEDGAFFIRIETTDLQGWDKVTHVRADVLFWPTLELRCGTCGDWTRIEP
eukprot:TRINITY_DN29634_c0_g1_i1.p1 TRINITY_DN29634_c0_g1~~TRINITY_DN29634_c0_g1_i1.p1  ORF type:complete len:1085 (-),score=202.22 TRINITY_DN29634_c0_g1_i1:230-3484(-)